MSHFERRRAEILAGRKRRQKSGVIRRAERRAQAARMLHARRHYEERRVTRMAALRVALALGLLP